MKNLLLSVIVLSILSFSCSEDQDYSGTDCAPVAAGFFEVYDPYKAYLDLYDEQVRSGAITDSVEGRMNYLRNDPEKRFQKVSDYAAANIDRCGSLKGWGRGRMEPYR